MSAEQAPKTQKTDEKNTRNKVPPLMWAFAAVLALGAGTAGYILGEYIGERNALDQVAASGDTKSVPVTEIPEEVEPGTQFKETLKSDDGSFDAQIFGPGSPVTSRDDIENSARRDEKDPMAIGALDAPVVIAEFTDWECPYCIKHAAETDPELIKEYVDTGYVRIEWNDMPVQGPASETAAKAGRAAAEQGKFFEYKDAYMAAAAERGGHPGFELEDYLGFAEEAGVPDLEKFEADATSDKYDDTLRKALEYAQELGINGTPAFIVGNEYIGGADTLDNFRQTINGELKRSAAQK